MRRAARIDANHAAIVNTLRKCGCEVQSLAACGQGVPDALVYHRATNRLMLVEIKDGTKSPSTRRLTPDQIAWHARWPVAVVTSANDVPGLLGAEFAQLLDSF